MTNTIEKNISEILGSDYAMDSAEGDGKIGQIVAESYRLFPADFLRAYEYAEERRHALAREVVFSDASDSEVRDRMIETLRMFCQREGDASDGSSGAEGAAGYRFSMKLSPVDVDVMISMIDADADNEHDKGEDEGLRAELGASLRESLVEINGAGGTILMTPGQFDLISMLADNWLDTGADCLRSGPDDFTEEQERALVDETETTLKALHARLIPAYNPVIVL